MSLRKDTIAGFIWDFLGTLGTQGATFIISIVLARLLLPEDYGLIGMAMVFVSFSQVFVDFGFSSGIIQKQGITNLACSSIFYINLIAGITLTTLLYFSAPLISDFYGRVELVSIMRCLSPIFFINALMLVQIALLKKQLNFKVLTIRSLFAAIFGGIVGVIFAFLNFGPYALVAQQLTSGILSVLLLWGISSWRPQLEFSFDEVKEILGFSSFLFFDRLLASIFNQIDVLFVGKAFSPATLGFYTRANSLRNLVTKYSSTSLKKVFFPVLSKLKNETERFNNIYFKAISAATFVSFLLTGVLYVLGEEIIIGLFGQKWLPSVVFFQILILSICNRPINILMLNALISQGKSKENFYLGLARKFFKLIPLFVGFKYGMIAFVIALVVLNYSMTLLNIFSINYFIGIKVSEHLRRILHGLIPLMLVILIYNFGINKDIISKLALAICFVVFFVVYSFYTKNEALLYVWAYGKKKYLT